jgi:aspartate/glutamate racemase
MTATVRQSVELPEPGIYRATKGRVGYGIPIGMLMLDCNIPFVPGDIGNASTFGFPIMYQVVPGASTLDVMHANPELGERFVDAARYLESQGVKAITGDCGYMAVYQELIQQAVDVPVFMSSLFQVPLVLTMLRPSRKLAVIVASDETVHPALFESAGIDDALRERVVLRGAQHKPHFNEVMMLESGRLDLARMTRELTELAVEIVQEDPSVGAFLLECSDLPPYSHAISQATGLPVFDWASFIDYVQRAVNPRPYQGVF